MIDHELLQRRLNASVPPARPGWPMLAAEHSARYSAMGLSARDEARVIRHAFTSYTDHSIRAFRVCGRLRERRRLTRETWLALRHWARRWRAFEDAYVDWRLNGGGIKADRLSHGGSKRDVKRTKAQRQARKKARSRR